MKTAKKILVLLFILILCLPCVFACGEKDDVATVEPDDVAVVENGDVNNGTPLDEIPPADIPPPEEEIAATAKLLGLDFETKGDWVGNYGKDGYIIFTADDSLENVPKYAKWDSSYPEFYLWWETGAGNTTAEREKSALLKGTDSEERIAACYYTGEDFTININVGKETKKISLYMNDFDAYKRAANIKVYDKKGNALKESVEAVNFAVGEYVGGCYLSYIITGEVQFEFVCTGDNTNVVLSGIFFDPAP
jgi:hypothetical protein